MERPRQPERHERTGIIQIALIGLMLAVVLAGGVHLLARTHAEWDRRYGDQSSPRATVAASTKPPVLPRAILEDSEEAKLLDEIEAGRMRCLNGQLFRRLPNGWENLPDRRC